MSTDITTTSTSTSLVKRAGLIALFAVLALLMGAKFSGALVSGPASSGHSSAAAYANPTFTATGVSDTYGTGSITVSWYNPATTSTVSGYSIATTSTGVPATTILCTKSGGGVANAVNSCTFTPTTALATYAASTTLYVLATVPGSANLVDTGSTVSLSTLAQPTGLSLSVGNSGLDFKWSAGNNSANPLAFTKSVVYNGSTVVCTTTTDGECITTLAASGLTAGGSYDFYVVSYNAAGASQPSASITSKVVGTTPSAPTGVTATVDYAEQQVVVSWTASASTGGSSLTYTVLDGNQVNGYNTVTCASTTATSCTISLATASHVGQIVYNSTSYDPLPWAGVFVVKATNTAGLYATAVSATTVINAVPNVPTASGWDHTVLPTLTASWSAGSETGSTIAATSWSVQLLTCPSYLTSTGCTASGSPVSLPAATTSYSFNYLPAGGIYSYSVTAVNAAGAGGVATYASPYAYLSTTPSQPLSEVTNVTNSTLSIGWLAPTLNGGSAVTSYTVSIYSCAAVNTARSSCAVIASKTATTSASATSYTFTGLDQTKFFFATVTANNVNGAGVTSYTDTNGANEGIAVTPSAPTVVYTATGETFVWGATPLVNAQLSVNVVSSYTIYDTVTGVTVCTAAASALQCSTTKLTSGNALNMYTTDASGVASAGVAMASAGSYTKPSTTPSAVNAATDDLGNYVITWTDADTNVGSYTITAISNTGKILTFSDVPSSTGTLYKYLALTPAQLPETSYTFYVAANNAAGTSTTSNPSAPAALISVCSVTDNPAVCNSAAVQAYGPPSTPSAATISYPSATSLTFTWSPVGTILAGFNYPASGLTSAAGYPSISGYLAYVGTLTDLTTGATQSCLTQTPGATYSCTFTGLSSSDKYSFSYTANTLLPAVVSNPSVAQTAYTNSVPVGLVQTVTGTLNVASTYTDGTSLHVAYSGVTLPTGQALGLTFTAGTATAGASNKTITVTAAQSALLAVGEIITDVTHPGYVTGHITAVTSTSFTVSVSIATTATGDTLAVAGFATTVTNTTTGAVSYCDTVLSLTSSPLACDIGSLTPGATYSVSSWAIDAAGASTPVTTTATMAYVPGKATNITAVPVGATLPGTYLVTWTAPASNGGSPVTSYSVSSINAFTLKAVGTSLTYPYGPVCVDAVSLSTTITNTSAYCSFTGHITSEGVNFKVNANNSVTSVNGGHSSSAYSPTVYVQLPAVAPASAVYAASTSQVSVGWVPSSDTSVTSFTVKAIGGSQGVVSVTAPVTATSQVFTYGTGAGQLTYGSTYVFQVYENNLDGSAGPTTAIAASAPVVPSASKAYIQNTLGTSTSTGFTIQWSGTSTDGLPITWTVVGTSSIAPTLSAVVTTKTAVFSVPGMTSTIGASYAWSITATSAGGSQTEPAIDATITNQIAPTVPTAVSAAAGTSTKAKDGSSNLGSLSSNADEGVTVSFTTPAVSTNTVTTYVTLKDAAGNSYASTVGVGSSYCAYGYGFVLTTTTTASTCAFDGLSPATTYTYTVTSTDVAGSSTTVTGYVTTAQSAPAIGATNVSVVAAPSSALAALGVDQGTLTVSWTPSVDPAVTGYVVFATTTAVTGSGSTEGSTDLATAIAATSTDTYCTAILTATSTSCVISGITANTNNQVPILSDGTTAYVVWVIAVNQSGSQEATAYSDVFGTVKSITAPNHAAAPANPTLVTVASTGVGSLAVSWKAASAIGALPILSYIVYATGSVDQTIATCTTTTTTCTLTGLSNSQNYSIVVKSVNGWLTAPKSIGTTAVTWSGWLKPQTAASITSAVGTSNSITVNWTWNAAAASAQDNATLTGFTVIAQDSTGKTVGTCGTVAATATTCSISPLAPATTFTVLVIPTNAVGSGMPSTLAGVKTAAATAGSAPVISGVTSTATGLRVTWTPPTGLGAALLGYTVTATDALSTQQTSCPVNATYGILLAPAVTCDINGLVHNDVYTVTITAVTAWGLGAKATSTATFTAVVPEPVIATFATSKKIVASVATGLSAAAKTALSGLISSINDGASITVTGYGKTKAIAQTRANAAASFLFNNGAAAHVTIVTVISKSVNTALITVTSN